MKCKGEVERRCWVDGPVGNMLALQVLESEFNPWNLGDGLDDMWL